MRAPRRPPWPLWAAAAVTAWLALGALAVWLARRAGVRLPPCLFKHVTGVACPTCGFTRGGLCMLNGRLLAGWLHNPLLFTLLAVLAADALLRVAAGRSLRIDLTRQERPVALGFFLALFLANWAYVIVWVG